MNEVWLLEINDTGGSSDDDWNAHLVFSSQTAVLDYSSDIVWKSIYDAIMYGSWEDVKYRASPFPVHGDY